MYGVAVALLGVFSIIAAGLVIDSYSTISNNGWGIAEMPAMSQQIDERTDTLDFARKFVGSSGNKLGTKNQNTSLE